MREVTKEALSWHQNEALEEALKVLAYSYNPYSLFRVGACLYDTQSSSFVSGTNVENGAYGSTICAERAAIVRANAEGKRMFTGIAIIARGNSFETSEVTGPCGSCRQMLYELSQISGCDLEVVLATSKLDKILITSMSELLPLAFGPKDLGIDIESFRTT
jgi:cytidine deaminase